MRYWDLPPNRLEGEAIIYPLTFPPREDRCVGYFIGEFVDFVEKVFGDAFRDFIRNFVSVEEIERVLAREMKAKRKKRKRVRAAAGGVGGGDGDDDDGGGDDDHQSAPSWNIPSDDDEEEEDSKPKIPIYLQKLELILLRGHSSPTHDSLTSSSATSAIWMPCTSIFIHRRVNVCMDGWSITQRRLSH